MATLTRWDPFREMATLRRTMDRFFDEPLFETALRWPREEAFSLALDVAEKDDSYIVKASVPGVNPEDIEITEDKEVKEEDYHLRERHYGSFMRTITLPMAVNADKIEAVNEHGVLTLTIPKSEAVKPKKIAVKTTVNGK
jgi:HSP20 family protein